MCVYIYICEREKEKERKTKREREGERKEKCYIFKNKKIVAEIVMIVSRIKTVTQDS